MGDAYALTVERDIPGPIDGVFDAWLDPAVMQQWMTPAPDVAVEAEADPVVGGRFRIVMRGQGRKIVHVGEYIVIDRPARLVFTWTSEPAGDTLVTVEFTPLSAQRTRVRLTHERFATGDTRDLHRGGWTALFGSLEKLFQQR